ncbi:phage tail assembly protein [Pyruvatibacter mobilis]|uniref:phage tail assembly protein n=1 Tax=Pyruvatibacter mobilis TaxID=1712261 RepID=UPI003C7B9D50
MRDSITLQHPVTVDGRTIESVSIRRMKVRDQLAAGKASKDPGEQEIHLLMSLTEQPREVIEEMDVLDYAQLQRKLIEYQGGADFLKRISDETS